MYRRLLIGLLLLMATIPAFAQATAKPRAQVRLRADTTSLMTGERYTVRVDATNVTDWWSGALTIRYDPEQIYVIGTRAGSPVDLSDALSDNGIVIRNMIDSAAGQIQFVPSLLAPAEPLTGTVLLGEFEIVPLLAGETQLTFEQAALSSVTFSVNDAGTRVPSPSVPIDPQGVLLSLSIAGDPATPPPEATSTPTPTPTRDPILDRGEVTEEVTATPFQNVTAAPETPTPFPTPELATPDNPANANTPILIGGVVLVVLSLVLLGGLFVMSRRNGS